MDNGIASLLSWQFILFSLGIFVAVWVVRTVVEYIFSNADGNKLWEKLILPLMPVVTGAVVGYFAKGYAYPDGLSSVSGRLFFGSVAGMFSSLMYQVVKGLLKDKIQGFVSSAQPTPQTQIVPFSAGK